MNLKEKPKYKHTLFIVELIDLQTVVFAWRAWTEFASPPIQISDLDVIKEANDYTNNYELQ